MRRPSKDRSRAGWKPTGWKALGLASLVGVAATGAVVARAERRRRAYTPDEVRARLRARHADAAGSTTATAAGPPPAEPDRSPG
jgi:hypothetical protein